MVIKKNFLGNVENCRNLFRFSISNNNFSLPLPPSYSLCIHARRTWFQDSGIYRKPWLDTSRLKTGAQMTPYKDIESHDSFEVIAFTAND